MFRKTIGLVYDFFLRGWWDVVKRKSLLKVILFGAETKEEIESGLSEAVIKRGFVEQFAAVNFALTRTHC